MTPKITKKERRDLMNDFFIRCGELLDQKSNEYVVNEDDAFSEIRITGEDLGVRPDAVLWIYARKHISALASHFRNGQAKRSESIESRLRDLANYCALLSAYYAATEKDS